MELTLTSIGDVPLIEIAGDVDHGNSQALQAAAESALALGGPSILFGLRDCPYLDSAGVGVLLSVLQRLKAPGWVGVIAPDPNVLRLLEIVGLLSMPAFRIFSNEQEARAALA
jgi:anti-anti-sigma factor